MLHVWLHAEPVAAFTPAENDMLEAGVSSLPGKSRA
jgi:hypothetical protein